MDNEQVQLAFLVISIAVALSTKVVAYLQGASMVDLIFGMRVAQEARFRPEVAILLGFCQRMPVVGLAIGRLWLLTAPSVRVTVAWWLLFATLLIVGFTTGGRTAFAFPLVVLVITDIFALDVLMMRGGRLVRQLKQMRVFYITIAAVVIVGFSYQSLFRSTRPGSVAEAINRFTNAAAWVASNDDRTIRRAIESGLNGTVSWVVGHYGESIPYTYGYSVYAMVVNPVPRFIWRDKPPGWGQRLAFEVLRKSRFAAFGTSMAAGIGGEAYSNAGLVGSFVFGVLFGLGFGVLGTRIYYADSLVSSAFALAALSWMPGLYRGDWLSNVNRGIYCLASAALVLLFLRAILGAGYVTRLRRT